MIFELLVQYYNEVDKSIDKNKYIDKYIQIYETYTSQRRDTQQVKDNLKNFINRKIPRSGVDLLCYLETVDSILDQKISKEMKQILFPYDETSLKQVFANMTLTRDLPPLKFNPKNFDAAIYEKLFNIFVSILMICDCDERKLDQYYSNLLHMEKFFEMISGYRK
ncbi:hypothetical protein J31TS4_17300 [Paenibacillus sp. J31TS4]|uniref:hypothetical protein n=1 Tax=Paenibacillus sp. J31TS4 TaxID=2807195 RepID=UPI001AFFF7CA|nr:hypothetical protein [Paenibacillus sp. J31TS4]GIP38450.1 hypothetical protein J31TS4_17300 [Paenibacillus sp. J31TS4]